MTFEEANKVILAAKSIDNPLLKDLSITKIFAAVGIFAAEWFPDNSHGDEPQVRMTIWLYSKHI